MGFGWNTAKNLSPIGVDFGTDSVKALQVTLDEPPQVVAAASADIPDEARKDADTHRRFVADALRDMLGTGRFKGKRVVASISAAHTYTQHLRLARAEGAALMEQIEGELRGRLPLDPSMLVIRHVNVGEVFSDGGNKQEVICLAASREHVMRSVQMVRAAGYDVVGMHCEPMSILQSFTHLFRRATDADRTTMFVDIGAATTKALISHGRNLVFAKTIHVAGDHFNRQLAAHLKVTPHEARMLRIRGAAPIAPQAAKPGVKTDDDQGMPMIDSLARSTAEPPATADLRQAAATDPQARSVATAVVSKTDLFAAPDHGEMLEALTDELHLCIGYHDSLFHDRKLDKAVFIGGEARHTKMCQRIAEALRLPAQLGDPLARLTRPTDAAAAQGVDLGQAQPGWAVPLGLCLLPTNL